MIATPLTNLYQYHHSISFFTIPCNRIRGRILKTGRWEVPGLIIGRLSTYLFGFFHGFLRNSRIYRLGFLRKTPKEGIHLVVPGPISGQMALILQPNRDRTTSRILEKNRIAVPSADLNYIIVF